MLDGASRLDPLIAAAVADGQPALGITDHGNMYGVLDFYAKCRKAGINPVIGTEAYMAAETRHERPVRRGKVDDPGGPEGGDKLYYHLTLLAETTQGYHNLMKLSSAAYLEGYYYKPRLDWELLEQHPRAHRHHRVPGRCGLQSAGRGRGGHVAGGRLQDIFGKDNLFVEIQDHGLEAQRKTNPQLIEIAQRIGAPLLATNDSHYTNARTTWRTRPAMRPDRRPDDDPNRFQFEGEEHYLKTAAEMRWLFREVPQACDSSLLIAERAHVEIEFGTLRSSVPRA